MSPDIAGLAAYAGKYEKSIFSKLFNALDAVNDLTLIENVKNKMKMTKLRAGDGARPFSATFEATDDDLIYTEQDLEVALAKRDIRIEPSKYRATWMSESMKEGVNALDIPFAAYVWEQVMIELAAEINDKTIYFGFDKSTATAYSAATAYAVGAYITFVVGAVTHYYKALAITVAGENPTTTPAKWQRVNAEAICVGLKTRIAAGVTASTIGVEATGAIVTATALAQHRAMYRSMPVAYRQMGVTIYESFSNFDKLVDDYEDKVGKFTTSEAGLLYLPGTDRKCIIKPATWMGSSGRLICTPKKNLLIGTDKLSDMNKINTEPHLRTLDGGIDFALGTQIRDHEAIRVNDQV